MIANFFMEGFEEEGFNRADYKSVCWFHCISDRHSYSDLTDQKS
jgi:hypothetical protein